MSGIYRESNLYYNLAKIVYYHCTKTPVRPREIESLPSEWKSDILPLNMVGPILEAFMWAVRLFSVMECLCFSAEILGSLP